ncbi:MAG: type II toxin-antitoxin system HicA family toxin [Planctomycetota bacterium]|nr:type II toxin-antitoxin system HicA family toxin [Planctomycetota bacterium]
MMPRVPVLSGREAVRAFEQLGWQVIRQAGSHVILVKENHPATLSVPDHKEVAKGTLRSLIRSAGLTVDEFVAAIS